uniref:Uncharacterized protein n=1 Tax=Octactis speculum TaxID=3111310 RepID=A0A7S2B118_9STRA
MLPSEGASHFLYVSAKSGKWLATDHKSDIAANLCCIASKISAHSPAGLPYQTFENGNLCDDPTIIVVAKPVQSIRHDPVMAGLEDDIRKTRVALEAERVGLEAQAEKIRLETESEMARLKVEVVKAHLKTKLNKARVEVEMESLKQDLEKTCLEALREVPCQRRSRESPPRCGR